MIPKSEEVRLLFPQMDEEGPASLPATPPRNGKVTAAVFESGSPVSLRLGTCPTRSAAFTRHQNSLDERLLHSEQQQKLKYPFSHCVFETVALLMLLSTSSTASDLDDLYRNLLRHGSLSRRDSQVIPTGDLSLQKNKLKSPPLLKT